MKLIKQKYRQLKPRIEYLADEVVMAQAWKKTHGYIRSFNWYADTLALDVSALGIEKNAKSWSDQIQKKRPLYEPELVPAAKSEEWVIDGEGWHLSDKSKGKRAEGSIPLRPLAHMTVRDQTWSTAAMLCLADAVESYQRDCSHTVGGAEGALKRKVYSYGNRLLCDWKTPETAWFRWGNSEIYRKFYTDYQNFLKRPIDIGRRVAEQQADEESVFIVNLDLTKFYNTIDRRKLLSRLKKIAVGHGYSECAKFWEAFNRITDWQWRESDVKLAKELKLGEITEGLPQGLVAAGFFANAYLAEIDKEFGECIGKSIDYENGLVLHDYCRYVDDLRLVVSSDKYSVEEITDLVNKWALDLYEKFGEESLEINKDKTKVTQLSDLDNDGSMSNRIEMVQQGLSGPADREMLESSAGVLEGILAAADSELPTGTINADLPLLKIATFDHDIRSDTLKRFAANRLESIVRSKRKLTLLPGSSAGKNIKHPDNENELLAKKLIFAWMKDPSLGLVLRKAIEIFPSAELFEPVFKSIYSRSSFADSEHSDKPTESMMDYLLADLFRCAADFNGSFQVVSYPEDMVPEAIIENISRYAQKVVTSDSTRIFVKRQALMLLAVVNKPVVLGKVEPMIRHHQFLHTLLAGSIPSHYESQFSALFEIAGQITDHFDTFAADFMEHISNLSTREKSSAIVVFAMRGGPFWLSLWKQIKKTEIEQGLIEEFKWAKPQTGTSPAPRMQRLSSVIASEINGFEHESGLIKLALGLIKVLDGNRELSGLSPVSIDVKLNTGTPWSGLYSPAVQRVICSFGKKYSFDPRFIIPIWIAQDDKKVESEKIYWLGMILRAAAVGGVDFTGNRWKIGKTVTYKGLRSSWFKRRMGMMHSPEALVGEYSTLSTWTTELLMRCLQWPGFESTYVRHADIKATGNIKNLEECLEARLKYLNSLYCESSDLPVVPTLVQRPRKERELFRVVTVQQLLPRDVDFHVSDLKLDRPAYRIRHREHLLDTCQLIVKTLEAKLQANNEDPKPKADLIVFPELAVHQDDHDVIKRLVDKTQAIVFAGTVFSECNGKLVNTARWFIPDYRDNARQWIIRDQGKHFMTEGERKLNIVGNRPCQHLLEIYGHPEGPFRITGAICYDATDIKLAADLKNHTDLFVVCAHNKDIQTFDNMVAALQYHMYQHVVVANSGQYGGSTIQAPYKLPHHKLISHSHGSDQISINIADIDLAAFRRKKRTYKEIKAKPAGD